MEENLSKGTFFQKLVSKGKTALKYFCFSQETDKSLQNENVNMQNQIERNANESCQKEIMCKCSSLKVTKYDPGKYFYEQPTLSVSRGSSEVTPVNNNILGESSSVKSQMPSVPTINSQEISSKKKRSYREHLMEMNVTNTNNSKQECLNYFSKRPHTSEVNSLIKNGVEAAAINNYYARRRKNSCTLLSGTQNSATIKRGNTIDRHSSKDLPQVIQEEEVEGRDKKDLQTKNKTSVISPSKHNQKLKKEFQETGTQTDENINANSQLKKPKNIESLKKDAQKFQIEDTSKLKQKGVQKEKTCMYKNLEVTSQEVMYLFQEKESNKAQKIKKISCKSYSISFLTIQDAITIDVISAKVVKKDKNEKQQPNTNVLDHINEFQIASTFFSYISPSNPMSDMKPNEVSDQRVPLASGTSTLNHNSNPFLRREYSSQNMKTLLSLKPSGNEAENLAIPEDRNRQIITQPETSSNASKDFFSNPRIHFSPLSTIEEKSEGMMSVDKHSYTPAAVSIQINNSFNECGIKGNTNCWTIMNNFHRFSQNELSQHQLSQPMLQEDHPTLFDNSNPFLAISQRNWADSSSSGSSSLGLFENHNPQRNKKKK